MKNDQSKRKFEIIPSDYKKNIVVAPEKINFSPKAINTMMTEQIVMPPARVWDRIEKILDEQDDRRKLANSIISNSFKKLGNSSKRKNVYIAALAAAGVVAGILWKVS